MWDRVRDKPGANWMQAGGHAWTERRSRRRRWHQRQGSGTWLRAVTGISSQVRAPSCCGNWAATQESATQGLQEGGAAPS